MRNTSAYSYCYYFSISLFLSVFFNSLRDKRVCRRTLSKWEKLLHSYNNMCAMYIISSVFVVVEEIETGQRYTEQWKGKGDYDPIKSMFQLEMLMAADLRKCNVGSSISLSPQTFFLSSVCDLSRNTVYRIAFWRLNEDTARLRPFYSINATAGIKWTH